MSKGRALLIFAFCIWETARGGLNATSGMWQAVKAGSPAISGGSLSCCWRFLFTCSANSAGGSWSPASQEKVIVHRVNSIILNNVQFCTLTLQFWDTWGVWPRETFGKLQCLCLGKIEKPQMKPLCPFQPHVLWGVVFAGSALFYLIISADRSSFLFMYCNFSFSAGETFWLFKKSARDHYLCCLLAY